MTTADTRKTIARYFDLMASGIDLDASYSADVTWLIVDTGRVIRAPTLCGTTWSPFTSH